MADKNLTSPVTPGKVNSEHFQRTRAEKLREVDAGALRDVTADDLGEMYLDGDKSDKHKNHLTTPKSE